ncbi:MAG TPA: hypothetical protein V6D19_04210 [Stenomitos sp.]
MAAKPSIGQLILAAIGGGSIAFLLTQLQFSAWIETNAPDATPPIIDVGTNKPQPQQSKASATPQAVLPDGLRIRNTSPHAVRVVLLVRRADTEATATNTYQAPIHWDFAPQEGSQNGLLLSLPEGNLKLHAGDILTAFATDGARRYWGPYVVGTTGQPIRQTSTGEWQLVLKP